MNNLSELPVDEVHSDLNEESPKLLGFMALPQLLRSLGAVTLLVSVSVYLLQGWGHGSDIFRYLLLLGHTVGLAVIGFLCSHWLKEQKGARVLFSLVLVFVAANFTIIGALLYSIMGTPVAGLMGAVTWVASAGPSTMVVLLSAVVLLVPMVWFGFAVLARQSANLFTGLFLFGSAALLVPVRADVFVFVVLAALAVLIVWQVAKAKGHDVALATREGKIAQLILWVPLVIMFARNAMYGTDAAMPWVGCVGLWLMLRQAAKGLEDFPIWQKLCEVISLPVILTVAILSAVVFDGVTGLPDEFAFFIFASVLSTLLYELAVRAASGGSVYSVLASVISVVCFVLYLLVDAGNTLAGLCIVWGGLLTLFGIYTQRRMAVITGGVLAAIGVVYWLMYLLDDFSVNYWFGLALVGALTIVLGSYIEKRGLKMKLAIANAQQHFAQWGY